MVKAIRTRETFWVASAIVNIVFISAFFILLNMKSPRPFPDNACRCRVHLRTAPLYCGFIADLRWQHPHLLYRLRGVASIPLDISAVPPPSIEKYEPGPRKVPPPAHATDQVVNDLVIVAINRMAMAVPFYYDTFATDGPVCGSFLDKVVLKTGRVPPFDLYLFEDVS